MSSKAKVPDDEVRNRLDVAIDLATALAVELEDLRRDERWSIWNLGGAAFGRPGNPGPGTYTAHEFAAAAQELQGRLEAVRASFSHRERKEAERQQRRAERNQAAFEEREARRQQAMAAPALARFVADDPMALWQKGDLAEDLGWESTAAAGVRLLRLVSNGQVLSMSRPFERGLVEEVSS